MTAIDAAAAEAGIPAMKPGVSHPAGPVRWWAQRDAPGVMAVPDPLDTHDPGEPCGVSPWLRQQAWGQP